MANLTKLPERNLDVLRAIAVLLVLSDHLLTALGRQLPFVTDWALGRAGVLLFFVHTSLVLMSSIERSGTSGNWVRSFYVRRGFRIYPLAIAVILAAILLQVPPSARQGLLRAGRLPTHSTLIANLTLTQNLVGAPDIQGVLWSLPLEIQMYAVLPLAFLLARRSLKLTALGFCGAVVLALLFPVAINVVPGLWRFNVISFSPFFMFGVLCYSLLHSGYRMPELKPSRFTAIAKTVCTYSYGIYLLHVPAIWLAFIVLHSAPYVVQWGVFGTLIVALPYTAYRAVELPGINYGRRLAHARTLRIADVGAP